MKKINLVKWLFAGMIFGLGCKKESGGYIYNNTAAPPAFKKKTSPTANAGYNFFIAWPQDSTFLTGYAWDAESNIKSYLWEKIHGPSSVDIENPTALKTRLSRLEKGDYDFLLTVTDSDNLVGRDTVTVVVMEVPPSPNEIIFGDLYWSCPMGCSVSMNNFYSFIPFGKPYKVFLKKAGDTAWKEVVHESKWADHIQYVYGMYEGSFWIYTNDEEGKIDVKIVY